MITGTISGIFPEGVSKIERWIFVGISLSLLLVYVLAFSTSQFWLLLLPLSIFLFYFSAQNLPMLLYLTVLVFPFSFMTEVQGTGSQLQLPTEIFVFLLILSWLGRLIFFPMNKVEGTNEIRKINIWLITFLSILFLSILWSHYPIFTVKLLANNLWYITACYVFLRYEMRDEKDMRKIFAILFLSANVIVTYALLHAAQTGFSSSMVNRTFKPFFNEHGSYAAYLGIVFGISLGLSFGAGKHNKLRLMAIETVVVTFLGIVFSYTRAAWLGVAGLALLFFIVKAKEILNPRAFILTSIIVAGLVVFVVDVGVVPKFERTAASMTDLEENFSNLERINRWVAALNMIKAHPLTGVGYGTYPKEYQKYRDPRFATPISFIYAFPHNDYLEYFSEAGIFALLSWLLFLFYFYWTGVKNYFRMRNGFMRNALLGCMGGVFTYNVHAFLNDFLLFDKAAVPFWVCIGISVVIMEKASIDRKKDTVTTGVE